MMKILFLIPYPLGESPSQRFRFEQYLESLKNAGYTCRVSTFLPASSWRIFYQPGHLPAKLSLLLGGFFRRVRVLATASRSDFIFLHREAAPIGPPVFEWILTRVLRKKIIYDFDDAIWLTDKTNESAPEQWLRWRSKVGSICRWSYKISCGNDYLADYARQFNPNVIVNPTTIDTENLHNPALYQVTKNPEKVVIGWTGSHSTLKYLTDFIPVIRELQARHSNLYFLVIADRDSAPEVDRYEYIPWNKVTEAADLLTMDVGIMPLPDDVWTRGKCGFKALQYMSMEIPCVVSPVGVNSAIIEHGVNGFLATTLEEWMLYLEELIHNETLRRQLGQAGRKRVIENYSVISNTSGFCSLFES
ncbi:MAG: glycosyltransferase family 4 protein [Cyclobacteriaceae bacterium]|jgi:glycosyltransferase involved in cell wall biosynthesis|nr:glycosyltransferase family 4 protein [Cyclobacteriaceae bacterium]